MRIGIRIFQGNIIASTLDSQGCDIGDEDDYSLHIEDNFLDYHDDEAFITLSKRDAKQLADYIYNTIGETK